MIGNKSPLIFLILTILPASFALAQDFSIDLVTCTSFLSRHSDNKVMWAASELIPSDGNLPNQKFQHIILRRTIDGRHYPVVIRSATSSESKRNQLGIVAHQLSKRIDSANQTYSIKEEGYHSTCSRSDSSKTSACANMPLTFDMSKSGLKFKLNPKEARLAKEEKLTPLSETEQFDLIAESLNQQISHFESKVRAKSLSRDEKNELGSALASCENVSENLVKFAEHQTEPLTLLTTASLLREKMNNLKVYNAHHIQTDSIGEDSSKKGRVRPTNR